LDTVGELARVAAGAVADEAVGELALNAWSTLAVGVVRCPEAELAGRVVAAFSVGT
jgi:hypothetical protein